MRLLIVDQDSAMLEALARALRERYVVDAVTNKGDCLDLLRQNAFEVIIAGERLEDGSGLGLLGQGGKRWPTILRIFAADPHRLRLLKGRLGPFALFQTLRYPIDPQKLLATLQLARAAREPHAGKRGSSELGGKDELQGSGECPPPRPEPRAAPAEEEPPVRVRLRAS